MKGNENREELPRIYMELRPQMLFKELRPRIDILSTDLYGKGPAISF